MKGTYIIHFNNEVKMSTQYGDKNHYVGFSGDVLHRIDDHFNGYGAVPTKKAYKNNIAMNVGAIIASDESLESEIICLGIKHYCEICKALEYLHEAGSRQRG